MICISPRPFSTEWGWGIMARSEATLHALGPRKPARSRTKRTYSDQFKADAVAKARASQSIAAVAKDLGVAPNTLGAWVRAAPPAPMTLLEAVQSGSRKTYLMVLRDTTAAAIAGGMSARDRPPNVRILNDTIRELEELEAREREEAADAASAPDEELDPNDL